MAKILIVEDEDLFRDILANCLLLDKHEVVAAANGKVALDLLKTAPVDLVISDVRMPEMDGVELTKAIRAQGSLPVILMTGFSEIMETQAAYKIGANDFIAKPFKREDLEQAIQRCLAPKKQSADNSPYCKLGINDFLTGKTIQYNVFVRLSPNLFVKVAHKGEDLSTERIRSYREKGLHHLYLKRDDFRQYVGFSLALTETARNSQLLNREKKLRLLRHTGEILNEQIRHDGVDPEVYESASAFVDATVDILTDDVEATEVLDVLRAHADHLLVHSVAVSVYSVMLAQQVQWNQASNRFKVAMGGLLHDVGMKELAPELINRPRRTWTHEDAKTFESHPLRGIDALDDMSEIPEDVRDIVKQHHENCLAQGYPSRLKKAAIHPMDVAARKQQGATDRHEREYSSPKHDLSSAIIQDLFTDSYSET